LLPRASPESVSDPARIHPMRGPLCKKLGAGHHLAIELRIRLSGSSIGAQPHASALSMLLIVVVGFCAAFGATSTTAQQPGNQEESSFPFQTAGDQSSGPEAPVPNDAASNGANDQGHGAFVIAPLPISSPALGSGIVPVFAYIFPFHKDDKTSPPSVIGTVGLATNNGSRAFALGGELYFNENTYHMTTVYSRGNLNYDLYGLGDGDSQFKLPLRQNFQLFFGEFLRCLGSKFFLGPRFLWGSSLIVVRPANGEGAPLPPDLGIHTNLSSIGFRLTRDTRPNRFYPTTGTLLDFTSDFFSKTMGSKYSFQSYRFTFSKYWSVQKDQVLAYNLFSCVTGGQPPFYSNCIYGTDNRLRGYVAGRYLDRYMVATQLEYRVSLRWRLGLTTFGGLGEVVPGGNQVFRQADFLPSGGGGARFELSKRFHVNLRVDIAQGVDGHTWSMGVGEAF
jgi:Omp85 superfamily domain